MDRVTLYHPWGWIWAILAVVLLAWAGSRWCRLWRLPFVDAGERLAFGLALSTGALSYLVLTGGLLGRLQAGVLWSLFAVILLAGAVAWWHMRPFEESRQPFPWRSWLPVAIVALLVLPMVVSPPAATDWDGLSYHLAAPAIWLREGRIGYIPFMHQSNFPFVMEMQYLWALGIGAGAGGAKVFHWTTLLLTLGAVFAFARRAGFTGSWAAVSLISVPVVLWEATVAYADLATTAYTLLCLLAAWNAAGEEDVSTRRRWLALAGLMGGLALGTKMTALGSVGLLVVLLAWEAVRRRPVRLVEIAGCMGVALLVGAPWYIKTYMYTGNPVYPYFYELFGGRNWTAEHARIYREAQLAFGLGREPHQLLMSPFNLTFFWSRFFDPLPFVGSVGFVYLAGLIPLFFARRLPDAARWWILFSLVSLVLWFVLMQQVRYLMTIFPLVSLWCGWLAVQAERKWTARAMQVAIVLQMLWCAMGFSPLWSRVLTVWKDGPSAYLQRALPGVWQACDWINRNTPREAGVILYDETRGFYLQRRYLWGNPGHHTLIDYDSFTDGDMLVRTLHRMGYQVVLQNVAFAPPGSEREHWRRLLVDAIARGALVERFRDRSVVVFEIRPRPFAIANR
ncbi:MAG: ArnT family glycosyltransferase [Armatimonadota bacterium]